jgi:type IV secretion system protein VirB5
MKKLMHMLAPMVWLVGSQNAFAGLPVFDAANLAQAVVQVQAWGQQFQQMEQQFGKLKQQYESLNGARGMARLANNPALRNYLPSEYQDILNRSEASDSISGSIDAIRAAAMLVSVEKTGLATTSDAAKAFTNMQNQNALNRAVGEEGYRQASRRFADIQILLEEVGKAPEQKDMLDLQGRIQAEQVMMQNEQNKLNMMTYLAQAQRDIQQQQGNEIMIKATKAKLPTGW